MIGATAHLLVMTTVCFRNGFPVKRVLRARPALGGIGRSCFPARIPEARVLFRQYRAEGFLKNVPMGLSGVIVHGTPGRCRFAFQTGQSDLLKAGTMS